MVTTAGGGERPGAGARPRSRRFWVDPRFLIGLGLIVVAVTGTVFVVAAADPSTPVLRAREALVPGQFVAPGDLVVTEVAFADAADMYLTEEDVTEGVIATRAVSAGELVPQSAVGEPVGQDATTLVVEAEGRLAASVAAGAVVDVWSAGSDADGETAPPTVIVTGATVARIATPDGIVVNDAATAVELLVPRDSIARVLGAEAAGARLSIVPASVPLSETD
jgi:hypothetical protein